MQSEPVCGRTVFWWDGEYEGECELPPDHDGDHFDGLSWFNDLGDCTDYEHREGQEDRCPECGGTGYQGCGCAWHDGQGEADAE